jgi:hypothetical protein
MVIAKDVKKILCLRTCLSFCHQQDDRLLLPSLTKLIIAVRVDSVRKYEFKFLEFDRVAVCLAQYYSHTPPSYYVLKTCDHVPRPNQMM